MEELRKKVLQAINENKKLFTLSNDVQYEDIILDKTLDVLINVINFKSNLIITHEDDMWVSYLNDNKIGEYPSNEETKLESILHYINLNNK